MGCIGDIGEVALIVDIRLNLPPHVTSWQVAAAREQTRTPTIALGAEAFETERVIAVRFDNRRGIGSAPSAHGTIHPDDATASTRKMRLATLPLLPCRRLVRRSPAEAETLNEQHMERVGRLRSYARPSPTVLDCGAAASALGPVPQPCGLDTPRQRDCSHGSQWNEDRESRLLFAS